MRLARQTTVKLSEQNIHKKTSNLFDLDRYYYAVAITVSITRNRISPQQTWSRGFPPAASPLPPVSSRAPEGGGDGRVNLGTGGGGAVAINFAGMLLW